MSRSASVSIQNTASKGLITEATGLNFPENAWTDALNVTPDNKGVTSRRRGINYEIGAGTFGVTRDVSTMATGLWTNVAGQGDFSFIITQVGTQILFYHETEGEALSMNKKSFFIDMEDYAVSGATNIGRYKCEFANGKGYLFITHPFCEPVYVSYDVDLDSITVTSITVQVRDFEGVDDGLEPDESPLTLTDAHEYNLCNQGWYTDVKVDGVGLSDPIAGYYTVANADLAPGYPPNNLQWWLLKNSNQEFSPGSNDLYKQFPNNSLVPKGHFILDWFNTSRSTATDDIGTVTERTAGYYRPRACAFFAGRVWYAGVESSSYIGEVYFSQIIERDTQFGQCYQVNDPTSENLSDLLATDGGVVKILDIGSVYKLFATQKALLIFASNGIWAITGSDTSPFKATEYTVSKVSGSIAISNTSFVDVQGFPLWWNDEGIYIVRNDDVAGFKLDSLTNNTIKQLYTDIPANSKRKACGAYNPIKQVIQWLYSSRSDDTEDELFDFDRILNFNILTGAFYEWSIDTTAGALVNGIIATKSISENSVGSVENVVDALDAIVVDSLGAAVTIFTTLTQEAVYDQNNLPVLNSSGNQVYITRSTGTSRNYGIKYLTTKQAGGTVYDITFSEEYVDLNKDWHALGAGVSYNSYFRAGYQLKTDAQRFGQNNYIIVYSNVVEDASAFIKVIWDYGRVTGAVNQIYRNNLDLGITQTRIMLRGRGRVFQYEVTSDGDAPFETIGWSVFETQNSSI